MSDQRLLRFFLPVTLVAGAALCPARHGSAREINIVVPGAFADAEADAFIAPLPEAYRVQYFYASSEFASLPADNNVITKLSWRPDGAQDGPIAFTSERMIMQLSPTAKGLDEIDMVLDNNITSDPVVVYDGPWNVTSQNTGPAGGPKDFDYTVEFQQPFVYDPAEGNLVIEFTVFGSSADFFGDFTVPLDVPSRAIWTGADVNSPTSTGDLWGGAVVELTFVPEPSALALAVTGLLFGLRVGTNKRVRPCVAWRRPGNRTYLLTLFGILSATSIAGARVPQGFFTAVRNVGPISGIAAFDFIPAVSPDGLTLYFNDTHLNNEPSIPGGHGQEDIWMATRDSVTEQFDNVVNLGPEVNSPFFDDLGSVSLDGLTIYFGSNRNDDNFDLYQAMRDSTIEQFGNVQSLGREVNTDLVENITRVTADGLTLVYQVSQGASTDHDVWIATRESTDQSFANARPLEMNSDTVSDWFPSLSSDGLALFTSDWVFAAPRQGGEGGEDIWVSVRETADEPFGTPINPDDLWPDSEVNSSIRAGSPFISFDWPAQGSQLYWLAQGPGPISGSGDIFQATWVSLDTPPELRAGDADQNLEFDQVDLVKVQIASKYLTGQPSTWGDGDWDGAPGGEPGNPPAGNGVFDQRDIIAAAGSGVYLTGPYGTVRPGGQRNDIQTSIVYDANTGEVAVDTPSGTELTSINIDSAAGIFTANPAQNLGGSFDNDADNNIFKATFGSSFGSLSFGEVAGAGLDEQFLVSDLTVIGSLAGGGDLGNVDLVYIPVPEPGCLALLLLGLAGVAWGRTSA